MGARVAPSLAGVLTGGGAEQGQRCSCFPAWCVLGLRAGEVRPAQTTVPGPRPHAPEGRASAESELRQPRPPSLLHTQRLGRGPGARFGPGHAPTHPHTCAHACTRAHSCCRGVRCPGPGGRAAHPTGGPPPPRGFPPAGLLRQAQARGRGRPSRPGRQKPEAVLGQASSKAEESDWLWRRVHV